MKGADHLEDEGNIRMDLEETWCEQNLTWNKVQYWVAANQ
jgi:hypothetical protein